jgi:RNA polymerase sigma factor (sigma-70 family)
MDTDSGSLFAALLEFRSAKNKNASFEYFFGKFEPLLKKYARLLGESDYKYFLAEALYNALLKMPIDSEKFRDDKYILSYIRKAVASEYINLAVLFDDHKAFVSLDDLPPEMKRQPENLIDKKEFEMFMQDAVTRLTKTERCVFYYSFIMGHTDTATGYILSVSRQSVSRTVKRIRSKLSSFFEKYYFE